MGDSSGDRGAPEPSVYVSYPENEYGESMFISDLAEVENLYGVKIIRSEYDAPIKNSFGLFK